MTVSIIGAGVVGQATGRGFLAHGHDVVFMDVDTRKIEALRREGLVAYLPADVPADNRGPDVSILTVSTPTENGHVSLEPLAVAARDLGRRLKSVQQYQLVVVRSTVPPGTMEELVIPIIERESGRRVGRDFGACMNPEYLREQTATEDFLNPWIIVIGEYDRRSGDLLNALYRGFPCPVHRVSVREAELQKYIHNLYNAVKISFFNEMRGVSKQISIDAERIFPLVARSAEGMWNPEYGIRPLGPFAGSCLPKDTNAFLSWARDRSLEVSLLETAVHSNDALRTRTAGVLADHVPVPSHRPLPVEAREPSSP